MKNLFFILLILPFFVCAENSPETSPKGKFNKISREIISALQVSSSNKGDLTELQNVIEKNKDFLSQESNQKFLIEFLNSEKFHEEALESVYARVSIQGLLPFFTVNILRMTYFNAVNIYGMESSSLTTAAIVLLAAFFNSLLVNVLTVEVATDLLIVPKFKLQKPNRKSVILRTFGTCQKLFQKPFEGF